MPIKKNIPDLQKTEYDILRILWKEGPQSVREVHNFIKDIYGWAYTTTKTMMDRMVNKDFLIRENFHGVFIYKPVITRPAGLVRLVQFFADRVLEIDPASVVNMFVESKALTSEEIKELEKIIKEEKEKKDD